MQRRHIHTDRGGGGDVVTNFRRVCPLPQPPLFCFLLVGSGGFCLAAGRLHNNNNSQLTATALGSALCSSSMSTMRPPWKGALSNMQTPHHYQSHILALLLTECHAQRCLERPQHERNTVRTVPTCTAHQPTNGPPHSRTPAQHVTSRRPVSTPPTNCAAHQTGGCRNLHPLTVCGHVSGHTAATTGPLTACTACHALITHTTGHHIVLTVCTASSATATQHHNSLVTNPLHSVRCLSSAPSPSHILHTASRAAPHHAPSPSASGAPSAVPPLSAPSTHPLCNR